MQTAFQPSPGSHIANFQLQPLHCMACRDNVLTLVRRIVGIDEVQMDFDTALLRVSFFPPATESSIRWHILKAQFEIVEEAPSLTIAEVEPQAIPA